MDERDEVEQHQFQTGQSKMKKDKKTSKTDSRFKLKLEALKKLPHATSANSALDKARAFFRSLDFKHHHRHEQPSSSSNDQYTTTHPPSSSSDEDNQKKDLLRNSIHPTTNISISKSPRVQKINPRDMIVHRVLHNDNNNLPSNYFQQKYKQYLKPSLLLPKQYYNDLLNRRSQNYPTSINTYDVYQRLSVPTLNPNFTYRTDHNEIPSHHLPPLICHEIESSYNEQYHQFHSSSIIRPSSSMLAWNQCVRRLNTEYRLTIDALQQVKECLEQVYSNSKYTRVNKSLSNNETKKIANVTFCLPPPPSPISNHSPSLSISTNRIEQNKIFSSLQFSKPKLVKPVQLDTFFSSPKFEPVLSIVENDEKLDSIANIIKKFNDLSRSLPPITKEQTIFDRPITNPRVHFKPSVTTYELREISDQSPSPPPPPSSSSELVLTNEEHPIENDIQEEETIYTVETFYKTTDDNKHDLLLNDEHIVVIQEQTTEEEFNLARQEIQTNHISLINNTSSSNTTINSNNKINSSSIPLKNNNKSISHIPKRITTTTNVSRLKQPSKIISFSSKIKPPFSAIANNTTTSIRKPSGSIKTQAQVQTQKNNNLFRPSCITKKQPLTNNKKSPNRTDPTPSNPVKSMVHRVNTTASSRPSITNKRSSRPVSDQPTTSIIKNTIQRK